mgnify:CR=1 FL=1
MTRVLALDTATQACTLALWGAGDVRARHEIQARAHNRHILSMLHDVLEGRSLREAVDVIACGTGPGSFTGLRVAVSVAQGLAWAQDLPVHGFCSLTAQVHSAADSGMLPDDAAVLSTIDAQIDQIYGLWGRWRDGHFVPEGAPFACPPEQVPQPGEIEQAIVLGSGGDYVTRFPDWLGGGARVERDVTPNAGVMAGLYGSGQLPVEPLPAHRLSPQYVQTDIGWKKLSEQGRRD